jgi:elongation factor Ts
MTNTDLIRELRALTQAGMKDCREALEEAGWDLQKAVDIVKIKGLNIADGRTGRAASEGVVLASPVGRLPVGNGIAMVEVNCQTDFVAGSPDFKNFAHKTLDTICERFDQDLEFNVGLVEDARKAVVAITKENVVVRRWWIEETLDPTVRVFHYIHANNKLGVLLTLQAPNQEALNSPEFQNLGEELAMQVAAMNPLAVSADRMSQADLDRQKAIFETQLKEEGKPQAMWSRIMEGKMRKWNTEVCLLEQESVVVPKTSVKQVIKTASVKLSGEITVVNFIRCQVGEGVETKKDNLAEEVAKLTE